MRLKDGDRVTVKDDLIIGQTYGDDVFVDEMEEFKGGEYVIGHVYEYGYSLKEDIAGWNWTDEMLIKLD